MVWCGCRANCTIGPVAVDSCGVVFGRRVCGGVVGQTRGRGWAAPSGALMEQQRASSGWPCASRKYWVGASFVCAVYTVNDPR